MKIIFSHPTGNANVREALGGFLRKDMLEKFYTTIASFPGNKYSMLGKISFLSEFNRRGYDLGLQPYTKGMPAKELMRLLSGKAGARALVKHESGMFSVDAVYRSLDKRVATKIRSGAFSKDAVYGYEDGCFFSFRAAKQAGMPCLYDLPIGYWRSARRILSVEKERRPEWATTLTGLQDSDEKVHRKDEELKLADHIFVASSFTARTLKEYPGTLAPVHVIPYGFPEVGEPRHYTSTAGRQVKLLFVGGLSQRKGIAELFEATAKFGNNVSLTVIGQKASNQCKALDDALASVNWIPSLPHKEILKMMREHDVLLFPSFFEGFGLVITEAMSQGTPVITTDRTAGADLITHGVNGWLIEAGSSAQIETVIEQILHDGDLVSRLGTQARETAARRPWHVYGNELAAEVSKILKK